MLSTQLAGSHMEGLSLQGCRVQGSVPVMEDDRFPVEFDPAINTHFVSFDAICSWRTQALQGVVTVQA